MFEGVCLAGEAIVSAREIAGHLRYLLADLELEVQRV
jgi:hypothetical protein